MAKSYEYKSINIRDFAKSKYYTKLSKEFIQELNILTLIFPFKVNNYVLDELIDWDNWENDPIFRLVFPNRKMLSKSQFDKLYNDYQKNDAFLLKETIKNIWNQLNPHAEGQLDLNVPVLNGEKLFGIQHQYQETALAFPSRGQTCHSYCSFCFRWPQFIGQKELKISLNDTNLLLEYLKSQPQVTDLLLTGGDPMVMSYNSFKDYLDPLLNNIEQTNIQTIRIGTKSLTFYPHKFIDEFESDLFLRYFEHIVSKGINLSIMVHFNHPQELAPKIVAGAVKKILSTGAQIRTQAPLLKNINDDHKIWAEMWRKQVNLNMIPYYMFIARDTGAKQYFEVPLERAWEIFRDAYRQVSGVCKTVRGPIMSSLPGKVQVLGKTQVEKDGNMTDAFVLRFIQARNPEWVNKPFIAKFNPNAYWINDLEPLYGNKFFFQDEFEKILTPIELQMTGELETEINKIL